MTLKMKRIAIAAAAALLATAPAAMAQDKEQKDITTMAAEAADYLAGIIKLEDWQIYRVDSTFQYNFLHMTEEYNTVRRSGASNADLYNKITDRWYAACDSTFKSFFTPEQWKKYLRTTYGKALRAREKRQAAEAKKDK